MAFAPALGQQPSAPTQAANDQRQHASQQSNEPPSTIDRETDKPACATCEDDAKKREEARDVRDVAAQEAMADAANRMLCLAIIQIIIGAATICFVGWTVFETRRTANAGIRAAQSAHKAVKHSEKTAERQLRAYVAISACQITPPNQPGPPVAQIEVKNTGQTPAYDVTIIGTMTIAGVPYDGTWDPPATLRPTKRTIGSNNTTIVTHAYHKPIAEEQQLGIDQQTKAIYVVGKIRYTDIFGRKWVSHYRLVRGEGIGTELQGDVDGNDTDQPDDGKN